VNSSFLVPPSSRVARVQCGDGTPSGSDRRGQDMYDIAGTRREPHRRGDVKRK